MSEPWYESGLRFRCTRCGNCCTGAPGFVWVTEEEIKEIAAYRGESYEQFWDMNVRRFGNRISLREKANGDCVMYDRERGCTIYPVRPRQCRSWPFWQSNVATPEDWQRTAEHCPGCGQGDLISCEEIVKNLKLILM